MGASRRRRLRESPHARGCPTAADVGSPTSPGRNGPKGKGKRLGGCFAAGATDERPGQPAAVPAGRYAGAAEAWQVWARGAALPRTAAEAGNGSCGPVARED